MRALVLLLTAVVLAGCSSSTPIYNLAGVEGGKFSQDQADCRAQNTGITLGDFERRCMEAKGYGTLGHKPRVY